MQGEDERAGKDRRIAGMASLFSQRAAVWIAICTFAACALLGCGYLVWKDYRDTCMSAERAAGSLAMALEEHAMRSFDPAFLALHRVVDRVAGKDLRHWVASREDWDFAKEITGQLPQISSISLYDADGELRMITVGFPGPRLNVRDRDYFKAHKEQGAATFLGSMVIARSTGKPIFTISLRLEDRQGNFLGVALASMQIDYFGAFYRSLDLGPDSGVALLRTDGKPLMREPRIANIESVDLSGIPLFTRYLPAAPVGIFVEKSPFDGEDKLVAYRKAPAFPFVAVVVFSQAELLRPVIERAVITGIALIFMLLLAGGYGALRLAGIRREESTTQQLAASRDLADSILDSVTSHIAIIDKHGRILRTNRPWRQFGEQNGVLGDHASVGSDYLRICRDAAAAGIEQAAHAAEGIADVISGKREEFVAEYACDAPAERRWFILRVSPLRGSEGAVVVAHENITRLKRVEEELRVLASTDALTRLANRRAVLEAAEQEFTRARRYQQDLALVMFDCDFFKRINDQYGHAIGDRVLAALADVVRQNIREIDHAGRIGGEEFIVVLPHTSPDGACQFAERLRIALAETSVPADSGSINFTVSLGVGSLTPDIASVRDLLKAADDALYRAKHLGRNRVEQA